MVKNRKDATFQFESELKKTVVSSTGCKYAFLNYVQAIISLVKPDSYITPLPNLCIFLPSGLGVYNPLETASQEGRTRLFSSQVDNILKDPLHLQ